LARKVGPLNLLNDLTIEGGFRGGSSSRRGWGRYQPASLRERIKEYLHEEDVRVKERDAKKLKEAKGPRWTEPMGFFIPEIGTRVRLEERWEFRLFNEYRNKICRQLGIDTDYGWREKLKEAEAALAAGTILTVSRVYIRQGGKEYSSITFNIKKGAKVYVKDAKGAWKLCELKKGGRFWAKLSDVNKMRVVVDQETLAEN
jgi:hypothetical protein